MLGECIEHIGRRPTNTTTSHHPYDSHGLLASYGDHYGGSDWEAFAPRAGLWSGADLRMRTNQRPTTFRQPTRETAYHFHNFFSAPEALQHKCKCIDRSLYRAHFAHPLLCGHAPLFWCEAVLV